MSVLRRELIVNVSFLILANILIKPYYIFFIERNIQNQVGTAAWGFYFTLFSLSMLPQILLDLGTTSYTNKRISAERSELQIVWRDTVWIKPLLVILFLVVFVCITWLMGYWYTYAKVILWISLNQVLISGLLFFRAYMSGLGYFRLDSFFSIADKLIFIILFTIGLSIGKVSTIDHFLWLQSISMAIPFVVGLFWVIRRVGQVIPTFEVGSSLKIIRASLPYAGIFLLMVLFCRMEPVWLDLLRKDGHEQAGIYAAAYRLLDAANMMGFLFAGLLLPMFSFSISRKDSEAYQSLFDLSWRLLVGLSTLISFSILSQHRYIMDLLYVDDHPAILHLVILNLIPLTINYLMSTFITAAGQIRTMNYFFLGSIFINVCLHVMFTPSMGAPGAAVVAGITQMCTSILLVYQIKKYTGLRMATPHLSQLLGSVTIMIALYILLKQLNGAPGFKLALMSGLGGICLILSGIIPTKSIWIMMKERSL